jgi:hypothetical protein
MVRTQIQLKESQVAALRKLAANHWQSMAELIRRSIDLFVKQNGVAGDRERVERAKRAIGKFASDSSDGSRLHDSYLADAFANK